ncbi:MAG: helix-turn-helix domain-containing protein [Rhodoluna sp.]
MTRQRLYTPDDTWKWLSARMEILEIKSLDQLAVISGINKGTLSKYFHQIQRPTVVALVPLCESLQVSPETLLVALGIFPPLKGQ